MPTRALSAALLALGLACYVAFLVGPFTKAGAGSVGFAMPGWLFVAWGLEMARSELSHGEPLLGLLLLVVYAGNVTVILSAFVHKSRPLRLAVLFGSPVVLVAWVGLFALHPQRAQAHWGALAFCAAIALLGARALLLHYAPGQPPG